MKKEIKKLLSLGKSALVVGPTESGKTVFVKNVLIPELADKGQTALYVGGYDEVVPFGGYDVLVVDEFETFFDKKFLEAKHPQQTPYYTKDYLQKIKAWHQDLARLKVPVVYLLTRNESAEVENIVERMRYLDWGDPISVVEFEQDKLTKAL